MTNNLSKRLITRRDSPIINRYLKELSSYPVMSKQEQTDLFLKLKTDPNNQEIKRQLFLGNMRFVVTIAKQYDNKGVDLEDLISSGNFGLLEAIDQFDVNKGVAFTTYAAHWIRKKILEDLDKSRIYVRLPDNQVKRVNKARTFIDTFVQKNEREPSIEELAEGLDIDEISAKDVLQLIDYQNTPNTVEEEGENLSLFDTIIGDEANYDSDFLKDILKRNLTKKEYRIIKTFYFSNSKKQEELAEEFGLTLRRLIQIKDSILAKLKNNSELVEFYKG